MRRARLARGVALADVAAATRIDVRMLEHIEQGRFDQLPRGVYARAWIRAYAAAIDLDSADVLRRIDAALPRVDEDLRTIVEVRARASGSLAATTWRPAAAAAADALVLCAADSVFVLLSAAACGESVRALVNGALVPFAVLFAILSGAYFLILGGGGGRTLGAMVFGVPAHPVSGPVDLLTAGRRGARCFLSEASLLFGLR